MEPETSSAFNDEPHRELHNDKYQGEQNAGALRTFFYFENKRLHFHYLSETYYHFLESRDELLYLINIKTSE